MKKYWGEIPQLLNLNLVGVEVADRYICPTSQEGDQLLSVLAHSRNALHPRKSRSQSRNHCVTVQGPCSPNWKVTRHNGILWNCVPGAAL